MIALAVHAMVRSVCLSDETAKYSTAQPNRHGSLWTQFTDAKDLVENPIGSFPT